MLKERARLVAASLMLADWLTISAAFLAAHTLRGGFEPTRHFFEGPVHSILEYLPFLPVGLVLWSVCLVAMGAYTSHRTASRLAEAGEITKASGLAGVFFVVLVFVTKLDARLLAGDRISRSLVVLWVVLAVFFLIAERAAIRSIARTTRERGRNYRKIVIVGTSEPARAIARSIREHAYWGLNVLGFISDESEERRASIDGIPVLGSLDQLLWLTESSVIDEVILAAPKLRYEATLEIVHLLGERGVCARMGLLQTSLGEHPTIERLGAVPMLTFNPTQVGEFDLLLKRVVDLAVSVPLLIATLPIMATIAVAIRISSKGPALFRQARVGLRGRAFTLYKFRTMRAGAESDRRKLEHRNEMTGPVFKLRDDPRVTRTGRFLRRFSLDELPQLWNVVKGDMSLVGPRPPTPEEVTQYRPGQRRRLSMRPGLTCLWQITGRSEIDFDRWVALDLEYIDNWSPWLDIKILARTVPAVFSGRGAF